MLLWNFHTRIAKDTVKCRKHKQTLAYIKKVDPEWTASEWTYAVFCVVLFVGFVYALINHKIPPMPML